MVKSSSYYSGVQSCRCTYGPAIVCGTNLYILGSITLLWNISSRLSVGLWGCMLGKLIYRWWHPGGRKATVRPFSCHGLEDAVYCIDTKALCLPQLNKCFENPAQQRKASHAGSCLHTTPRPPSPGAWRQWPLPDRHKPKSDFEEQESALQKTKGFSPNLQRATPFLI